MDRFFRVLASHGERPALDDGRQTWSYRRLLAQVDSWIGILDDLGAARVACQLPNGVDWIALDLALLRSGRLAVPIPEFFSVAQQQHVLSSSGVDTLVTTTDAPPMQGFVPALRHHTALVLRGGRVVLPVHPGTAKVTFTSGTTGTPKGACLSADNLLGTAAAIQAALGGEGIERHLCALPLSLLLENVAGVYASLGNGSCIHVPPLPEIGMTGSSSLDVVRFVKAQNNHRPESLILVPQLLLALTAAAEFGMDLPNSYRFVAVGGGKVSGSLLERAACAGIPVYEGYGLTECGSVVAVNLPGASRPGTVGRPLPHVTVGIVAGEIQVIGSAMLGYLGEQATSDPIATGDLGSIDADGYLQVHGRRKHGFITAFGRNVSPEWIESELTSEICIAHAIVFGESLPANVALVVPRSGADRETLENAVAAANHRLPDYARIALWHPVPAVEFSAAGCVTDNGRPRRDTAAVRYCDTLKSLYAQLEIDPHAAIRSAGA